MIFQRNPINGKYNLHKRHGQFSGLQSSMFDLKMLIFSESFIFCRNKSHIFRPKYAMVWMLNEQV